MTEYARSRPRRAAAAAAAGARVAQLGDTSESLELVPPLEYVGRLGGGGPGAQPYTVEVDLQVCVGGGGCFEGRGGGGGGVLERRRHRQHQATWKSEGWGLGAWTAGNETESLELVPPLEYVGSIGGSGPAGVLGGGGQSVGEGGG